METTDITIQILRDIRDSIGKLETNLGARIDATNARLDITIARLDTTIDRLDSTIDRLGGLEGRFEHMEIYLGGEMVALRREVSRVSGIGDGGALVRRVTRCESDIAELKEKLSKPKQ